MKGVKSLKRIDFTDLVVRGTEWFSNLALLNLCWLLFSLPIVTLIPSTDTVFEIVHEWETEGKTENIFYHFKRVFQKNFKSSFKLGLPIFLLLLILVADLYFLSTQTLTAPWFQILKYAFYFFSVLFIIALLYVYPLMKWTGEKHIRLIITGFLLTVGHPVTSVGLFFSLLVLLIVYSIWPGMFLFFALSSIAWLMTKALAHIIEKKQNQQTT